MNKKIQNDKPLDFLEREGQIYDMKILSMESYDKIKHIISLDLNIIKSQNPIYKHTDIFTWGVFLPNAKREIIIDPINNIITSCKFSIGLITVNAKLK